MKTTGGVNIEPADVSSILLTLRDMRSDSIVNSRAGLEVKNANGGTVTSGLFVMQFEAEDMAAIGSETLQPRLLTIDVRLAGGGRATREIVFWVKSMQDVEAA